jgi:hypothetical protein
MQIKLLRMLKTPEGLFEIDIQLISDGKIPKNYSYVLNSEFYAKQFEKNYRKKPGKALNILK